MHWRRLEPSHPPAPVSEVFPDISPVRTPAPDLVGSFPGPRVPISQLGRSDPPRMTIWEVLALRSHVTPVLVTGCARGNVF